MNNFDRLFYSREIRHAKHLAYALDMASKIAALYDEAIDQAQSEIQVLGVSTMLDTFYVNVRLMGDFLVRPTSTKKGVEDFGPADFGGCVGAHHPSSQR